MSASGLERGGGTPRGIEGEREIGPVRRLVDQEAGLMNGGGIDQETGLASERGGDRGIDLVNEGEVDRGIDLVNEGEVDRGTDLMSEEVDRGTDLVNEGEVDRGTDLVNGKGLTGLVNRKIALEAERGGKVGLVRGTGQGEADPEVVEVTQETGNERGRESGTYMCICSLVPRLYPCAHTQTNQKMSARVKPGNKASVYRG